MFVSRKDLPGLAHFLEHMLFTGTAKYPKEGEYHEFIQQNGGMANAYTACYFTNYMLEPKRDTALLMTRSQSEVPDQAGVAGGSFGPLRRLLY